jgi:hypothetical protein
MPDWFTRLLPESWGTGQIVLATLALTVTTALVSLVITAVVLVRLPHDYFACDHPPAMCADRHPFVRYPLIAFKNLFGAFLIFLGIALSLPGVPGQGILTILMGAMLLDFPGKRRVERWLLRRRGVLRGINKLRARYGRPPLVLDAPPAGT